MYKIEYGVGLNENGRPCIELPEDYDQNPEDKFFAVEIARYYLQIVEAKMDETRYDQYTIETMNLCINLLGQIGDEMAEILYNGMKIMAESTMHLNVGFHVNVKSIEERDALPDKDILYDDKIYKRMEGLKVAIETKVGDVFHNEYFELVNGITNEHWEKI